MKVPLKKNLTGLLVLLAVPLLAQKNEVISAAGDSFVKESGSLSFTLGEVAIETLPTIKHHLTQGFHQPTLFVQKTKQDTGSSLVVFPNPVGTLLYIQNHRQEENLQYTVSDMRGITVREGTVKDVTEISFETLPGASYMLQVKKRTAIVQTFKIIKQ